MDDRLKQALVIASVPVFACFGVVANLMTSNDLPLFKLESLAIVAACFAVTLSAGLLVHACGLILRVFLLGLIALIYLDIACGGNLVVSWLSRFAGEWPVGTFKLVRIVSLLAVFSIILTVLWIVREHAAPILSTMFAVSLGVTLTAPLTQDLAGRFAPASLSKPSPAGGKVQADGLFIHLILDEFMAPAALRDDIDGSAEIRARIYEFFENSGFVLWERAFSRHFMSGYSIPDQMNYEITYTNTDVYSVDHVTSALALSNAEPYFRELTSRGYRVHVIQTAHLDFCENEFVTSCRSLDSFNPFSEFIGTLGSARFFLVLKTLYKAFVAIPNSYFVNYVGNFVVNLNIIQKDRPLWLDGYAFPRWFDEITETIGASSPGSAFVVHVLAPHAPYILDESCRYKGKPDFPYKLGQPYGYQDRKKSATKRKEQYERYFAQIHCVLNKLEALMNRLEEAGRLAGATIIVNGDHGSRISEAFHHEHMNDDDLVSNYASLFAVRQPGMRARVEPEFASIQDLFARFMGADVTEHISQTFVLCLLENNLFVRREMPRF